MSGLPARLRRYWETVRHLRPVQIYGRLWFRTMYPRPRLEPAPPMRIAPGPWQSPAQRRQSQLGPESSRFLNETRSLAEGWDNPAAPKLWRYNLHYFDDLNAEDAGSRLGWHVPLLTRWVAEHPPGAGNSGWEPYPTSLRIVNWIKWDRAGHPLPPDALHSLAVQARWLDARLEYHLLGNHLFANAKALVFAGSFFAGAEADHWRRRGLQILAREIPEQLLRDGGQFELSPMYQALALEDLLDLVNILLSTGEPVPNAWHATVAAMLDWLAAMSHPDGEIAFFNDAATGTAPSPAQLQHYAERLGYPARPAPEPGYQHLADSGYIRLAGNDAVALLDVARLGPDYLPGHAHADTLSFELSLHGRRCIVNSGTSVYGVGPERLRQRGTAAHNTVEIDGQNSSEVWSGFRVARRASPTGLAIDQQLGGWVVACSHDGYRWLAGRPRHRRRWTFGVHALAIADEVTGPFGRAVAAFHFHPELTPVPSADVGTGKLKRDDKVALRWQVSQGRAHLEPATWHPEFGLSLATHRLVVELVGNASEVTFSWG